MFRARHPILVVVTLASALSCSGSASPVQPGPAPAKKVDPEPPPPEPPPAADLDTDEAVRAAYEKATGDALHEDACIGRTGVGGVVLIGSFAHDRGCMVDGAFVGDEYLSHAQLAQGGLGRVGWDRLEGEERTAFALKWAEKVLYMWDGSFVSESEKAFELEDTPAFAPPSARVDGVDVAVTAWIRRPPGMQDVAEFDLVELRFTPDGVVMRTKKDSFGVEGARLD